MLIGAKRASHIDPPTSPTPSCGEFSLYRGENRGLGKDNDQSLTPDPELENASEAVRFGFLVKAMAPQQAKTSCVNLRLFHWLR